MRSPAPLLPETYYHIFNRGTNRENLFRDDENYRYFLRLYAHHVLPVAETFAYCLMPNHFHLLIRTRTQEFVQSTAREERANFAYSKAFTNLFSSYTMAINKKYSRTGSLFEHPFHRIAVDNEAYCARLVAYIHRNPSKHGFVKDFREWTFSSYHATLSQTKSNVMRDEVIGWYGSRVDFESAHLQFAHDESIAALIQEDFD